MKLAADYSRLPKIMVAPNGARRTRKDHPALPVTIAQTVEAAIACKMAGADGLHAHVRDGHGNHTLDVGLYKELLSELKQVVPDMYVQITTEAVGKYQPVDQCAVVSQIRPAAVSISIREMLSQGRTCEISDFYHEQVNLGVAVQHILYSPEEITLVGDLCAQAYLPSDNLQLLFVLGRYTTGQNSDPDDILPFIEALKTLERDLCIQPDWACCAFGQRETTCLIKANELGGKIRIGFENNLHNLDGSLAKDNSERVKEIVMAKSALTK